MSNEELTRVVTEEWEKIVGKTITSSEVLYAHPNNPDTANDDGDPKAIRLTCEDGTRFIVYADYDDSMVNLDPVAQRQSGDLISRGL